MTRRLYTAKATPLHTTTSDVDACIMRPAPFLSVCLYVVLHPAVMCIMRRFMHLAAINRGILMTPFHNRALMSPATTAEDVDRHTEVFRESVELPLGLRAPHAASTARL